MFVFNAQMQNAKLVNSMIWASVHLVPWGSTLQMIMIVKVVRLEIVFSVMHHPFALHALLGSLKDMHMRQMNAWNAMTPIVKTARLLCLFVRNANLDLEWMKITHVPIVLFLTAKIAPIITIFAKIVHLD